MKAKDLAEFLMTVMHYATTLGIEAAVQIMSNWIGAGEGITAEDFRRLREDHKAPETYLSERQRKILGLPVPANDGQADE